MPFDFAHVQAQLGGEDISVGYAGALDVCAEVGLFSRRRGDTT